MRSMTETQDQEAVSSENPSGNGATEVPIQPDDIQADWSAAREERAERLSEEHAAAQEGAGRAQRAKPSGAAASLVDLSPKKFKTALTSLFKELDVDQAHWLKEIAESAENAAWKREAAKDPAPVDIIKGRDDFDSDLAYDNYIQWKFPQGDDAGGDDDGDQADE